MRRKKRVKEKTDVGGNGKTERKDSSWSQGSYQTVFIFLLNQSICV